MSIGCSCRPAASRATARHASTIAMRTGRPSSKRPSRHRAMLRCRVAAPSQVRKWRSPAIAAERSASVTASSESPASSARQDRVLWTQHVVSAARRAVGSSASTRRSASLAASALRGDPPSSQRTIESVERETMPESSGRLAIGSRPRCWGARSSSALARPTSPRGRLRWRGTTGAARRRVGVAGADPRLEAEARVRLPLGDAYEPLDEAVVEAVLAEDEPVRRRAPERREDRRGVPEALAERDRALEGRARVGRGVALQRRRGGAEAELDVELQRGALGALREIVERGQTATEEGDRLRARAGPRRDAPGLEPAGGGVLGVAASLVVVREVL